MIWPSLDSSCMIHQLRSINMVGLLETWREVVQAIKVNLGSRGRFQHKKNLEVLRWNLRKEVVLKLASLHVLLLETGTIGNAYWVPGFALDFVKIDTKWDKKGIFLLEFVSKLLVTFLNIMLQTRGISMHSILEEQRWMRVMTMMGKFLYFFSDMSPF